MKEDAPKPSPSMGEGWVGVMLGAGATLSNLKIEVRIMLGRLDAGHAVGE